MPDHAHTDPARTDLARSDPARTDQVPDQGFTLVEIVIAIVLVGVLSTVVVVGVGRLTEQGAAAACTASADAARAAAVTHYATHLAYPSTLVDMTTTVPPALTLPAGVTIGQPPTTASGEGWTLVMTPGTGGGAPTFSCEDSAGTAAGTPVNTGTAQCPGTFAGWTGEYYANRGLTGSPSLCRDDAAVDFDWASGAPAPGLPADDFSIRWSRPAVFEARAYTFTVGSDDGHRLYIDGVLVLDTWNDQSYSTRTVTRTMTAGQHTVAVEFYERGGLARASIVWS